MKRAIVLAFVFAALVATAPRPAAAWEDSLRCGVSLVSVGDSEEAVLDKCGRPTRVVRRTSQSRRWTRAFDEWTYDFGPTQFVRILSFDVTTDRLLSIVVPGDYGT